MQIHPTAVVDPGAELGDVVIGPYAVVGDGVVLHDGVRLESHAVVQGPTVVGAGTVVHSHAVLGGPPQDLKHDGSPTRLVIGEGNVFREFATAHRGTSTGAGITTIGDHNYFMASSHVAHDCVVGSHCMFANSAALGGHVTVGDRAVLGGLAGVHQFARIGRLAMIGAGAMCAQDIPPFALAQGDRARLYGLNIVGLKRAGLSGLVPTLRNAWRVLFLEGRPTRDAVDLLRGELGHVDEIAELLAFLEGTVRGVTKPVSAPRV